MFPTFITRPTRVVNINENANNINLFAFANTPVYPATFIFSITSNLSSNLSNMVALATGTGWFPSSLLYIKNNGNIIGAPSTKRSAPGMPGRGGNGGDGANQNFDPTPTEADNGQDGGPGGNGSKGSTGGAALLISNNQNVIVLLDNQGNISGGLGGPGGRGGLGGGGGGGGLAYEAINSGTPPSTTESGGGGDGGGDGGGGE